MEQRNGLKNDSKDKKIPLAAKVNYALMMSGITLMGGIGGNLEKFYTDFLGMVPALFGLAHMLFAIVNAINDPILGYFMDNAPHPEKGNKFSRFVLKAIPVFILGIFFHLLSQPGWNGMILFLCVFLGYSIFDTAGGMHGIAVNSLVIATSDSEADRGSFVGVNMIFQTFSGILIFLLPGYFLTGGSTYPQALGMFIGFGIGGIVLFSIGALILQRRKYPRVESRTKRLWPLLKRIVRQKSYVFNILISFIITGIAASQMTFYLYFMDGYLGLGNRAIASVNAIMLPVNFLVYGLAARIIKRIGIRNMMVSAVIILFIAYMAVLFPTPGIIGLFIPSLSFLGNTFWWIVAFPYSCNVMDEYADRHGERNQGSLFGVNAIFNAPAGSVVIFIFSSIITAFGYVGAPGEQPPNVKIGLRLGIGGVAVIFCVIAMILIILMPKLRSKKENSEEIEKLSTLI
ncbi:MAG: MFS transporter [Candidatus Hodarchaeota archaeon]